MNNYLLNVIRHRINVLSIFLFAILVVGCQTTNQNASFLDQKNVAKGKDFPSISWLGKDSDLDRYKGTVKPAIAVYLEKDAYFLKDLETIKQIQSIITRLKNNWQGEAPQDIEVIIESDPYFNARTDQYNQLFLTTKLLEKIKNDDELAAVLAHELSHILLKHNQDKSVYQSLPWTFEKAGALASVIEAKFAPNEKETTSVLTDLLSTTWADISSPAWTRENEREADKLGIDLNGTYLSNKQMN